QERMMAVVRPDKLDEFLAITNKWDVESSVLGEVTDTDRLVVEWHGDVIVDVPPRSVAHDAPTCDRPYARPAWQDDVQAAGTADLARPTSGAGLADLVVRMAGSPNLA